MHDRLDQLLKECAEEMEPASSAPVPLPSANGKRKTNGDGTTEGVGDDDEGTVSYETGPEDSAGEPADVDDGCPDEDFPADGKDSPRNPSGNAHFTDVGNGTMLVERHGDDLLYCHDQKTWYVWDGTRFAADRT